MDISLFAVYAGFGFTNYQNTIQSERIWNCFSFQIELDTWNSHDNENQNSLQIKLLLIHVCKGYKPKTVHSVRERTDRGP